MKVNGQGIFGCGPDYVRLGVAAILCDVTCRQVCVSSEGPIIPWTFQKKCDSTLGPSRAVRLWMKTIKMPCAIYVSTLIFGRDVFRLMHRSRCSTWGYARLRPTAFQWETSKDLAIQVQYVHSFNCEVKQKYEAENWGEQVHVALNAFQPCPLYLNQSERRMIIRTSRTLRVRSA